MSETKLVDESKGTARFAVGVLKGRPLSSSGMTYQFIRRNNETVALFSNGSMARFYLGPLEPETDKTSCTFEAAEPPVQRFPQAPPNSSLSDSRPAIKLEYDEGKNLEEPGQRIIAAFRSKGRRPQHPLDIVYCIMRKGKVLENCDRMLVGTGLREYLWLYAKLREFGRGRIAAMSEAFDLYFL